jgi:hypothetical protein
MIQSAPSTRARCDRVTQGVRIVRAKQQRQLVDRGAQLRPHLVEASELMQEHAMPRPASERVLVPGADDFRQRLYPVAQLAFGLRHAAQPTQGQSVWIRAVSVSRWRGRARRPARRPPARAHPRPARGSSAVPARQSGRACAAGSVFPATAATRPRAPRTGPDPAAQPRATREVPRCRRCRP